MIIAQSRILALLVAVSSAALAQDTSHEQAEIRNLMRATWERPNAPLSVDPVVVHDGYAIAGWVQDERGGRALLRKGSPGLGGRPVRRRPPEVRRDRDRDRRAAGSWPDGS